jgi:S1-C subfamily serine protease
MKLKPALPGLAALALSLSATAVSASDLVKVYNRVKSSVVDIEVTQKTVNPATKVGLVSVGGLGSGVLISDDGRVLTAAHVVQIADEITVTFHGGERIPARVLSSEPGADLALLQLERIPQDARVARIGNSDDVQVGQEIFVVGAPLGISHSLTVGHISGRHQEKDFFGGFEHTDLLQTDAAINQGNSGGPMFNMRGEVVGIVSYIISQGGGSEGLGFVITSNMAKRLLLDEPSMWSGIQGYMLTGDLARVFNLPQESGVLVQTIAERSPASHLGLLGGTLSAVVAGEELIVGGDIILSVMGLQVSAENAVEIRRRVRGLNAGDELTATVLRGGRVVGLSKHFFPDLLLPATPDAEPK